MKYFILNKLIIYCKLQTFQNTNALNEITLNEVPPKTTETWSETTDQQRTCISSPRNSSAS